MTFLVIIYSYYFVGSGSHTFQPSTYPSSAPDNFRQQSGMDIHRLDQAVQQYCSAALTFSTHKTLKQWNASIYPFAMTFRSLPSLRQKMCYATLRHVWANKIYQHLLLEPICRVFVKCILLVVFLILLLIICPGFVKFWKELKFRQQNWENPPTLTFQLLPPSHGILRNFVSTQWPKIFCKSQCISIG